MTRPTAGACPKFCSSSGLSVKHAFLPGDHVQSCVFKSRANWFSTRIHIKVEYILKQRHIEPIIPAAHLLVIHRSYFILVRSLSILSKIRCVCLRVTSETTRVHFQDFAPFFSRKIEGLKCIRTRKKATTSASSAAILDSSDSIFLKLRRKSQIIYFIYS